MFVRTENWVRWRGLEVTEFTAEPERAKVSARSRNNWAMGLWVTGSIPMSQSFFFSRVFQWFLISLSVRPGSCAAINDHLPIHYSFIAAHLVIIKVTKLVHQKFITHYTLDYNENTFSTRKFSSTGILEVWCSSWNLLPCEVCSLTMRSSSSSEKLPCRMSGRR